MSIPNGRILLQHGCSFMLGSRLSASGHTHGFGGFDLWPWTRQPDAIRTVRALNCDPHRYPMRTISKLECHHPSTEESAGRPDAALTSMTPTSSPTFSLCPRRVSVFHNHRFGQTLWDVSVQVVLNPLGLPVWPTFSK